MFLVPVDHVNPCDPNPCVAPKSRCFSGHMTTEGYLCYCAEKGKKGTNCQKTFTETGNKKIS